MLTWLNKKKYLQNNGSYEDTNADITASLIEQDVILEITNVEISQTHRCYYFYRSHHNGQSVDTENIPQ